MARRSTTVASFPAECPLVNRTDEAKVSYVSAMSDLQHHKGGHPPTISAMNKSPSRVLQTKTRRSSPKELGSQRERIQGSRRLSGSSLAEAICGTKDRDLRHKRSPVSSSKKSYNEEKKPNEKAYDFSRAVSVIARSDEGGKLATLCLFQSNKTVIAGSLSPDNDTNCPQELNTPRRRRERDCNASSRTGRRSGNHILGGDEQASEHQHAITNEDCLDQESDFQKRPIQRIKSDGKLSELFVVKKGEPSWAKGRGNTAELQRTIPKEDNLDRRSDHQLKPKKPIIQRTKSDRKLSELSQVVLMGEPAWTDGGGNKTEHQRSILKAINLDWRSDHQKKPTKPIQRTKSDGKLSEIGLVVIKGEPAWTKGGGNKTEHRRSVPKENNLDRRSDHQKKPMPRIQSQGMLPDTGDADLWQVQALLQVPGKKSEHQRASPKECGQDRSNSPDHEKPIKHSQSDPMLSEKDLGALKKELAHLKARGKRSERRSIHHESSQERSSSRYREKPRRRMSASMLSESENDLIEPDEEQASLNVRARRSEHQRAIPKDYKQDRSSRCDQKALRRIQSDGMLSEVDLVEENGEQTFSKVRGNKYEQQRAVPKKCSRYPSGSHDQGKPIRRIQSDGMLSETDFLEVKDKQACSKAREYKAERRRAGPKDCSRHRNSSRDQEKPIRRIQSVGRLWETDLIEEKAKEDCSKVRGNKCEQGRVALKEGSQYRSSGCNREKTIRRIQSDGMLSGTDIDEPKEAQSHLKDRGNKFQRPIPKERSRDRRSRDQWKPIHRIQSDGMLSEMDSDELKDDLSRSKIGGNKYLRTIPKDCSRYRRSGDRENPLRQIQCDGMLSEEDLGEPKKYPSHPKARGDKSVRQRSIAKDCRRGESSSSEEDLPIRRIQSACMLSEAGVGALKGEQSHPIVRGNKSIRQRNIPKGDSQEGSNGVYQTKPMRRKSDGMLSNIYAEESEEEQPYPKAKGNRSEHPRTIPYDCSLDRSSSRVQEKPKGLTSAGVLPGGRNVERRTNSQENSRSRTSHDQDEILARLLQRQQRRNSTPFELAIQDLRARDIEDKRTARPSLRWEIEEGTDLNLVDLTALDAAAVSHLLAQKMYGSNEETITTTFPHAVSEPYLDRANQRVRRGISRGARAASSRELVIKNRRKPSNLL